MFWHALAVKLLQVLLAAILPLLERRVLASERQAAATERTEDLLRAYLYFCHGEFRDQQLGLVVPEDPQNVPTADHGAERDLKAMRLEAIRQQYEQAMGSEPSDEVLMRNYEALYESDRRADPEVQGPGAVQ